MYLYFNAARFRALVQAAVISGCALFLAIAWIAVAKEGLFGLEPVSNLWQALSVGVLGVCFIASLFMAVDMDDHRRDLATLNTLLRARCQGDDEYELIYSDDAFWAWVKKRPGGIIALKLEVKGRTPETYHVHQNWVQYLTMDADEAAHQKDYVAVLVRKLESVDRILRAA